MTRRLSVTWPDPAPFAPRDGRPIRILADSDQDLPYGGDDALMVELPHLPWEVNRVYGAHPVVRRVTVCRPVGP